jgi:hypothetical protein
MKTQNSRRLSSTSPALSVNRLPLGLLLLLVGALGCPTVEGPGLMGAPECPEVTLEMVDELWLGRLDDAPAIEDYLGRIEGYCEAVRGI